jgi:hypothetical protein
MKTLIVALAGAFLGSALGIYAPVLFARVLSLGSGSYEEFLVVWLFSVPTGFIAGGWGGGRLMRNRAAAGSL